MAIKIAIKNSYKSSYQKELSKTALKIAIKIVIKKSYLKELSKIVTKLSIKNSYQKLLSHWMIEIIPLFIWGWQSLDSNSGRSATSSSSEVKNWCNCNVIPTSLRGLYTDSVFLPILSVLCTVYCVPCTVSVNYVEVGDDYGWNWKVC